MESTTIADRVNAWAVEIPLRDSFRSATSSLRSRKVVLIRLEAGGIQGWGEAAPVPGHTPETFEDVWAEVPGTATALATGEPVATSGLIGAAIGQATADLEAKAAGRPLWRHLGGDQPVWASAAIGLNNDAQPNLAALEAAHQAGYRYAKLKITDRTTPKSLQRARDLFPQISIGLDANESLADSSRSHLMAIDALGAAFLEQPGAATDLAWHAQLRRWMTTPIAVDEAAASPEAVDRVLHIEAADIVTLKAGRFGTEATLELAGRVVAAGKAARLGGLVESGIGRAHSIALGTCSQFSVTGDIAASDRYFVNDLVDPQWRLTQGQLTPPDVAGIGVSVDLETVDRYSFDDFHIG